MYRPDQQDRGRIAWIISITLHLMILAGLWVWEDQASNDGDRIEHIEKQIEKTRSEFERS